MYDLIIRNGTVIDGTGNPGFKADVAINGDRIATVGDISEAAYQTIDAAGRFVTPGFIDTHTHMDAQFMWDPLGTPACWHGITTLVLGSCGVSFAPVKQADHTVLAKVLESVEGIPAESIMSSFLPTSLLRQTIITSHMLKRSYVTGIRSSVSAMQARMSMLSAMPPFQRTH